MIILKQQGKYKKSMKDKLIAFFKRIDKKISPYKKNIIYPVLKILAIIIICALIVHFVGGHETLAQYAEKNPDIAYHTEQIKP